MYFWWSFATRSGMELQLHPAPGSKRSSKLYNMYQCRCISKEFWWWAERLPQTCRVVIPIQLESSASVGFIHREIVIMHGHTNLNKKSPSILNFGIRRKWCAKFGFRLFLLLTVDSLLLGVGLGTELGKTKILDIPLTRTVSNHISSWAIEAHSNITWKLWST
jgi:hypothetical protein